MNPNIKVPTYPTLIHSFFENLRLEASHVESTIKGVLIVLDETRLSRFLEMPKEDKCFLHLEKKINRLRTILERKDVRNAKNLQVNQLSLEMSLLHNMVSRVFFLRQSILIG